MTFERLPIFPLPDIVLLPQAVLPLHVFEPRYRAMTAHVLAGDGRLAIARLRPGYEADYQGRPAVFDVVGLGEVVRAEKLANGRYNMVLRGLARLRIERELPPTELYRLVDAEEMLDQGTGESGLIPAATLGALAERLSTQLPEGGETLRALIRGAPTPGALTDVLAACLISDPDGRQLLLETIDVETRLRLTTELVSSLLGKFPQSGPMN